jgi:subtilisin family serine protease
MTIQKLDPELRERFRSQHTQSAIAETLPPEAKALELVEIIVEFTGDLADLTAINFELSSIVENSQQGYQIATGRIPINRLGDLASIDHVVEAEGPMRYVQHLDYSLPEIRANVMHTANPERKGEGVVIGIIDSGIDWRHGGFIDQNDRTSRILAIWDQMLTPVASETSGPNGKGVEYTHTQISKALQGSGVVRTLDKDARGETDGHGTHVAGIAAGNGAPATCCHSGNAYVGVAPKAKLIVVRLEPKGDLGANVRIIEALNYIFNHPLAINSLGVRQPIAINISLGVNLGSHDGTSLVERAIDSSLVGKVGRAVVVAAGNFAGTRCHVQGSVPANNNIEIEFTVQEGHEFDAYLDLWYDRAGTLNLEVIAPDSNSSGIVTHGNDRLFVSNPTDSANRQVKVNIDGTINGPHSRDNNFRIKLGKPISGNIPRGEWKLRLTNPNAIVVNFHCWIQRGNNAPIFLPPINPSDGKVRSSDDSTIGIPSTAREAITVANHESRTDWCDCWPSTGIVASSSRGPVARGAAVNQKPDIAAPGLLITSAQADAANLLGNCWDCCPDACCVLYDDKTGTSMSAPHVTGTIALMLEENPRLSNADILKYLQAGARPAPAGGTRETWGAGKLDTQAAVTAVRNAGGGGGGPIPSPIITQVEPSFGSPGVEAVTFASASTSMELPPALRILQARMKALPNGQYLAAAVSRNFSEGRRLINTNRRVATMWHRSDGPRLLHRILLGAIDAKAPAAILTEQQREFMDRWCDLLVRYGSQRLRTSIEKHRTSLISLLETPLAAQVAIGIGQDYE